MLDKLEYKQWCVCVCVCTIKRTEDKGGQDKACYCTERDNEEWRMENEKDVMNQENKTKGKVCAVWRVTMMLCMMCEGRGVKSKNNVIDISLFLFSRREKWLWVKQHTQGRRKKAMGALPCMHRTEILSVGCSLEKERASEEKKKVPQPPWTPSLFRPPHISITYRLKTTRTWLCCHIRTWLCCHMVLNSSSLTCLLSIPGTVTSWTILLSHSLSPPLLFPMSFISNWPEAV